MSLNFILNREDGDGRQRLPMQWPEPNSQPSVVNSLETGPSRTWPWQRYEPFMNTAEAGQSGPASWQHNQPLGTNSLHAGQRLQPYTVNTLKPEPPHPLPSMDTAEARPPQLFTMPTLGLDTGPYHPMPCQQPPVMNTPTPSAEPPRPRRGLSITDILNMEPSQPEPESLSPSPTSMANAGPSQSNQVHHHREPSQPSAEESNIPPATSDRVYRKRKASQAQPRADEFRTLETPRNQVQGHRESSEPKNTEPPQPTMEEPRTLRLARHQAHDDTEQTEIETEEPQTLPTTPTPACHDTETYQPKMEPPSLAAPSNHGLRHIQPRPLPPEIRVAKRACTAKKVVLPPRPNRRRHLLPYEETIMWIAPPAPTEHPPTPNWVFGNGKGVIHPASSPTKTGEYERPASLSPLAPPPLPSPSQHSPPSNWALANGNGNEKEDVYPVLPEGVPMAPPPPQPHIPLPPTAHWVFGKNGIAYPTLPNRSSRTRPTARPPPTSTGEDERDGLISLRPTQDVPAPALAAPAKGKRSKFEERERAETALVREMRACIRCRNQRIRCVTLSNDPTEWCSPCMGVRPRLNKKIVHKIPCIRAKCTDVVLFRPGILGNILELGKKWEKLATNKDGTKAITMRFEFCENPVVLDVCLLQPPEGHIPTVSTEIPRYSVTDMHKTASWFKRHVEENALNEKTLEMTLRGAHPLVLETYKRALAHSRPYPSDLSTTESPHQKCLSDLLRLWFASRYLTESSRLCEPDTGTLGLESPDGKVPSPELIAAQIEYIVLGFLVPLRSTILSLLEDMVAYNKPRDWYTIYLAVFIILHIVAVESKERFDDAISKSVDLRYTIPRFVQELQWGGGVLLAHWFYYRRNYNPLEIKNRPKTLLSDLTDEQFAFMVESYTSMGRISVAKMREEEAWEEELYWISQMYDSYELRNAFIIDKDGPILIPEAMKEHYHGY